MRDAVIVDVVRTPGGRRNGQLRDWHPASLAALTLDALARRTGIDAGIVEDVIMGCVMQVGDQAMNIARHAVLAAGWPESVPGTTIDRQCGSSQQAMHFAAQGVMAGQYDVVVAAGVESMTRVPMFSSFDETASPWPPEELARYEASGLPPQGVGAEMIAEKYGLGRRELDEFSAQSQERALAATDAGRFVDEIVPVPADFGHGVELLRRDEGLRPGTTVETLAALRPAFIEGGVVTAGNSSQICDGASAIVTGGASGIGRACARELSQLGAMVVVADLQKESGIEVAREIGGTFVRCDVTSEADAEAAVSTASSSGPLRVLVSCAGVGRPARTVDRHNVPIAQSDFEAVVRVNLFGTFNVLRLAAAAMALTEPIDNDGARGVIVNIASLAAFDGQTGQASYAASKGALVAMTLPLARDLAAIGVRVMTVAPGTIDTPIFGEGDRADAMKRNLVEAALFPKRMGSPEELAFAVVDCVTNPYLNAETIRVDAGARLPAK